MSTPILQTNPQHLFVEGFLLGEGSRFKIQGSMFKVQDSMFKMQSSRFKVQDSRFNVQDSKREVCECGNENVSHSTE
jgi:hypothetical protein